MLLQPDWEKMLKYLALSAQLRQKSQGSWIHYVSNITSVSIRVLLMEQLKPYDRPRLCQQQQPLEKHILRVVAVRDG